MNGLLQFVAVQSRTQHAAAFLIGVSAMWISDALFEFVIRRIKPSEG